MANLHAFGDKIMGGGSTGGGHTIWDRLKTALTQRSILQFGGTLQVTDNPTDGATVVDDSAYEISWDDWDAMSAAEQDAFCELHPKVDVLDPPSVDGTISAELMKKLWENPSPSASFAAQTITLSSDDYDFLMIICAVRSDLGNCSVTIPKDNATAFLSASKTESGTYTTVFTRALSKVSNTSCAVSDCTFQNNGSTRTTNNSYMIPLAIYGIKSTINLKLSAIASDVNTAADHCMLSDGESVEDATIRFIDTTNLLHTISTADTSYTPSVNCWAIGYIKPADGGAAFVYIDNVQVCQAFTSDNVSVPICIPVKKNQTFKTRDIAGAYDIKFYGMS